MQYGLCCNETRNFLYFPVRFVWCKLLLIDDHLWLLVTRRFYGYSLGHVNPGNGTIWLDQVSCHGTEADIAECPRKSWGNHDCDHSEDVSIRCPEPPTRGTFERHFVVWLSPRHIA